MLAGLASVAPAAAQRADSPHGDLTRVTECSACHTLEGWSPARSDMEFDHDRGTEFALTGRHAATACTTCHIGLRFDEPRDTECASCHADVHRGSLGPDCASCHDSDSFVSAPSADAHRRTAFPLTGVHVQLSCERCHVDDRGGRFAALDTDCYSCHEPEYRDAVFVDHVTGGFPTDCLECHTVVAWRQTPLFDHASRANGFELLGAHGQITCEACHVRPGSELRFAAAGQEDCVACHQADYDREHAGSSIPATCQQCHDVFTWEDALFDHALTGFPLEGPHTSLSCESCHREPGNELLFPAPATPDDCVSCHRSDYDREHAGSGFPTTCLSCHGGNDWDDASDFDHAITGFDLVGAHGGLVCAECHRPSDNQLLFPVPSGQNDCVSCHRADYDREHTGSGFSTDCASCHTASDWEDADFDHTQTGFDLVGTHTSLACTSCHRASDNQLLFPAPTQQDDCVSCHQADYDQEHAGTGFPVTCLSCHDTTRFTGATFDHDGPYFPIYSGKHAGEWSSCATCHTVPQDYAQFSCLNCHEHRQSEMDDKHSDETGYVYQSAACLSCHPDGREDE